MQAAGGKNGHPRPLPFCSASFLAATRAQSLLASATIMMARAFCAMFPAHSICIGFRWGDLLLLLSSQPPAHAKRSSSIVASAPRVATHQSKSSESLRPAARPPTCNSSLVYLRSAARPPYGKAGNRPSLNLRLPPQGALNDSNVTDTTRRARRKKIFSRRSRHTSPHAAHECK